MIKYASHLLNRVPTTAIGDKTLLEIWSGGAARDHGLLRDLVVLPMLMSRKTCWTLR